jgi:hypothetical protein
MSNDWSGRLFPTTTRLSTFTEPTTPEAEAGRVREVGDKDTVERSIEASLTDHTKCPLDGISTLPEIFNLDEGLIFDTDPNNDEENIANLTTGDKGTRRDKVTTLSHLRLSSALFALALITILNTSLAEAGDDDEELTVTTAWEREEVK